MTSKVLTIENCGQCHNFDNHYYSYNEWCDLLNRRIKKEAGFSDCYPIPDDCPLDDAPII